RRSFGFSNPLRRICAARLRPTAPEAPMIAMEVGMLIFPPAFRFAICSTMPEATREHIARAKAFYLPLLSNPGGTGSGVSRLTLLSDRFSGDPRIWSTTDGLLPGTIRALADSAQQTISCGSCRTYNHALEIHYILSDVNEPLSFGLLRIPLCKFGGT